MELKDIQNLMDQFEDSNVRELMTAIFTSI